MGPFDGYGGVKSRDKCIYISLWFLQAKIKDFKRKRNLIEQIDVIFHLTTFQGFKTALSILGTSNIRSVPNVRVIVHYFIFGPYL